MDKAIRMLNFCIGDCDKSYIGQVVDGEVNVKDLISRTGRAAIHSMKSACV